MAAANGNGGNRAKGPRCIALVGPFQSGKTTLLESLLSAAGAIPRTGSVVDGSTVSDFDPLERKAQRSLNASLLNFRHAGIHTQLIDTPGSSDFLGQSLPALEAVDR